MTAAARGDADRGSEEWRRAALAPLNGGVSYDWLAMLSLSRSSSSAAVTIRSDLWRCCPPARVTRLTRTRA